MFEEPSSFKIESHRRFFPPIIFWCATYSCTLSRDGHSVILAIDLYDEGPDASAAKAGVEYKAANGRAFGRRSAK